MKFFGQATDLKGKPAARADFSGGVRAEHGTDGLLVCEQMTTYMDRTVTLARPRRDPKAAAGDPLANQPEPKPQIAVIDCVGKVIAISRKVDRGGQTPGAATHRRRAHHLRQARRASSRSSARGRRTSTPSKTRRRGRARWPPATPRRVARSPRWPIRVVAMPTPGEPPRSSAGTPPEAGVGGPGQGESQGQKAKAAEPPALVLTQIRFRNGMRGRFGSGKDADRTETPGPTSSRTSRRCTPRSPTRPEARPRRPPRRRLLPDRGHPPRRQRAPRGRRRTARRGTSSRPGRTSTSSRKTRRSRPTS